MIDARLDLAMEGGLVLPTEGQIAVINPPTQAVLGALPKGRVAIIEGFKPFHDIWVERGFDCAVELHGRYVAIVICLPRSKNEARALIAKAMACSSGPVFVDGQKTDGIDSIFKDMRKRLALSAPISKAHGKLFWCNDPQPDAFQDWCVTPALTEGGFWTAPGVFSADAVDPASVLLVQALPEKLGKQVGDFGAGWGYLSAHVLTRDAVEALHLVEADHISLECARRNVVDTRAVFHWSDVPTWAAPVRLDSVVMNPPFHTSRAADPALGKAFVKAAAARLTPQGSLWMVANRHLPYEQTLQDAFAHVLEVGSDTRFKLFHATRPKRQSRR